MPNTTDQLSYLTSYSDLISAYEEVAANRMQKVREKVLYNRDYSGGLNTIFQQLKFSYKKQAELYKKKIISNKNGKTASVLISANSGLYGNLVQRIFELFSLEWQHERSDVVITGIWGKNLFEQTFPKNPYTYFETPDAKVEPSQINKMVDFLQPYSRVMVYHGLFRNIIKQDVVWSNISGDQLSPEVLAVKSAKIIFEPSLEILLNFFEKEIYRSLLTQAIFESQLAKFSSRMTALEIASRNLEKEKKQALTAALSEKHQIINKKQQAAIGRFFY